MKAAICVGFLCASPYVLYQLFRFVSPALYTNELGYIVQEVLVSYYLIFPLTFRFLGLFKRAARWQI